jgi:predicted double-glycine peptidase
MSRLFALAFAGLIAPFATMARAGSVDLPVQVGGGYSIQVTSLKEARFRTTVRQQYDFSCGSAALSTLLKHHYDYSVTEDTVFADMFASGDRAKIRQEGFSLLDMKMYLEAHGFTADGYEASLDSLQTAGIPAIVLVTENGYSHFVVIKGVRLDRILVGDPAGGTRAVARPQFESMRVNQILFVITNRPEVARFNVAAEWNAAPGAPMIDGVNRDGIAASLLMKRGPSDF